MTPELELREDEATLAADKAHLSDESPFAGISQEIVDRLSMLGQVMKVHVESHEVDAKEQVVNKDLIETLNKVFTKGTDPKDSTEQAAFFSSAVSKELRIKSKEGDYFNSQLADSMGALVYTPTSRHTKSGNVRKTRQLCDYILESGLSLNPQQVQNIRNRVTSPIENVCSSVIEYLDGRGLNFSQTHDLLAQAATIDTKINLNTLKLASFATIVDVLSQPAMLKVIYSNKDKEVEDCLKSSKYTAIYEAATILDNIFGKGEDYNHLTALLETHKRDRLIAVPSLKFRQEFKRLESAVSLYVDLANAELRLKTLDSSTESLKTTRRGLLSMIASKRALEASTVVSEGLAKLSTTRDSLIEQSEDPKAIEDSIWQESITAESTMLAALRSFMGYYKQNRLSVSLESKGSIEKVSQPTFAEAWAQKLKDRAMEDKRPLIESLERELKDIDSLYCLTNKKLRERHPNLIKVSKIIEDMLNGHDTVVTANIRDVVGLILGVYHERTGFKQDPHKNSSLYLDDARKLRELSTQLNSLGQPSNSRLLKSTNLLDEMIDSGLFDNLEVEAHPELNRVNDFVKAYTTEKEMLFSQTSPEDQNVDEVDQVSLQEEAEDQGLTSELQPLPIEIIGQAKPEDILVFPPSTGSEEVIEEYKSHLTDELEAENQVQWERIIKLVELRDHCVKQGLEVNFIRSKQASWQILPFFVLEVKLPNTESSISVIESPVYGNATYTFKEDANSPAWREVVQLTRREARDWGASPAVHVDDNNLNQHIRKLWDRIIRDLTSF